MNGEDRQSRVDPTWTVGFTRNHLIKEAGLNGMYSVSGSVYCVESVLRHVEPKGVRKTSVFLFEGVLKLHIEMFLCPQKFEDL